jgi:hypothetical protein
MIEMGHESDHLDWPRLFSFQCPAETEVATKLALFMSVLRKERLQYRWIKSVIEYFESLDELVVIVDGEDEMERVQILEDHARSADVLGVWKLPGDIDAAFMAWKENNSDTMPRIPAVSVVESVDRTLTAQILKIHLRCNPCEYLQMGNPSLGLD